MTMRTVLTSNVASIQISSRKLHSFIYLSRTMSRSFDFYPRSQSSTFRRAFKCRETITFQTPGILTPTQDPATLRTTFPAFSQIIVVTNIESSTIPRKAESGPES